MKLTLILLIFSLVCLSFSKKNPEINNSKKGDLKSSKPEGSNSKKDDSHPQKISTGNGLSNLKKDSNINKSQKVPENKDMRLSKVKTETEMTKFNRKVTALKTKLEILKTTLRTNLKIRIITRLRKLRSLLKRTRNQYFKLKKLSKGEVNGKQKK